jgi:F-type H+-transporting ATPase subunit b
MPQLDPSSFASQIFWFMITFVSLYFILSKVAMPGINKVLQSRSDKINSDLELAEQTKRQAEKIEDEYYLSLKEAKIKAQQMIEDAEDKIKIQTEHMLHDLDLTLLKQSKAAELRISDLKHDFQEKFHDMEAEFVKKIITKITNLDDIPKIKVKH